MEVVFFDYISMLKSSYLASCSNDVVNIYSQLEHDIIVDMVKRLAKMGKVTNASEWQAKILKEIGNLQTNVSGYIQKYNNQAQAQIQQLFSDSMKKAVSEDVKMFNIAKRDLSASERQVIESTFSKIEDTKTINKTYSKMATNHASDQAFQKIKRLTMTVASTSESEFVSAANDAFMQVSSGAIDYDSAFKSAVTSLARKGIQTVEYTDSGKRIVRTIESAVRSNIMTGVNQNASEITLSNCEDLGTDLVEVSAHLGAREEHAAWQGKVYCLEGERDYTDADGNVHHAKNFYDVCKLGTPTGICGINCRHSYYPYFEGTQKQYSDKELDEYKDNKVKIEDEDGNKKEITQYEAEQMLRGYERNVRKYKTEADAFFESGYGDSPEALQAKAKIKVWQDKAKNLCKQTGIKRDYAREYIGTVSGKQPTGIKIFSKKATTSSTSVSNSTATNSSGNQTNIQSVNDTKNFDELENFINTKYGNIIIEPAVKNLHFEDSKKFLSGVFEMVDKYPDLNITKIETANDGLAACAGTVIKLNPAYFSNGNLQNIIDNSVRSKWFVKNHTLKGVGIHEMAHMLEWLIDSTVYTNQTDIIQAWNSGSESQKIVSEAISNIRLTPFGKNADGSAKSKIELVNTISRYAADGRARNNPEILAESFADCFANGANASPLSIEVKRLTLEKLNSLGIQII